MLEWGWTSFMGTETIKIENEVTSLLLAGGSPLEVNSHSFTVYSLSPPSHVLISSWISWNRGPFKTDWVLCSPGFSCLLRALVLTLSALWEFLRREFTCDVCIPSTSLISLSHLSPSEPHWVNRCVFHLIAFIWMAAAGILKQVCHQF